MPLPKGDKNQRPSPVAHADDYAARNNGRAGARDTMPRGVATPAGWRALKETFRSLAETDVHARMTSVSKTFVGKKFIEDPTGDGMFSKVDARPMLRLDAFDCQTLIETCMAVALTATPSEAVECLRRIRYRGGEALYDARHTDLQNHFLCHNVKLGFLRNITEQLLSKHDERRAASQSVLKEHQVRRVHGKSALPALPRTAATGSLPRGWLTYLPLNRIYATERSRAVPGAVERGGIFINRPLLDRIPSGTVCALVRGRVMHIGIAVQTAEGCRLRHAVRAAAVVREEKVAEYLFMLSRLGLCQGIMLFELCASSTKGAIR